MPNKTITLGVSVTAVGGQTIATLAAALAAVPIDLAMCRLYGLMPTRATSLGGLGGDNTVTVGQTATRTIVLGMNIAATPDLNNPAVATATVGGPGNGVLSLTMGNADANGNYATLPIVGTTGGGKGSGMTATPTMVLSESIISNQGGSYTGATVATLNNVQLAVGGRAPKLGAVTVGAGKVVSVAIVDAGLGLTTYPDITFTDSGGGSGASGVMGLSVDSLKLNGPGSGYTSAPTVTFREIFQVSNPDTGDQSSQLRGWMQKIVEQALRTPCQVVQPVVA